MTLTKTQLLTVLGLLGAALVFSGKLLWDGSAKISNIENSVTLLRVETKADIRLLSVKIDGIRNSGTVGKIDLPLTAPPMEANLISAARR